MQQGHCRLLILDDTLEDRTVIRLMLEEAAGRTWEFWEAEKIGPAFDYLENACIDCVLLDYQLPEMNGVRFLGEMTRRFGPLRFPVVMFTGAGREAVAVAALKAGAQDYLPKDLIRTDTLVRAIDSAIDRVKMLRERESQREQLEQANARLCIMDAAVKAAREAIMITDPELDFPGPRILFVNPRFTAVTGYSAEEVQGKTPRILQGPKTDRTVLDRLRLDLEEGRPFSGRAVNYRKDGSEFIQDWTIAAVNDEGGRLTNYVSVQRDATLDHLLEQRLQETEEHLELALRGADTGLWEWECESGRVVFDKYWPATLGYSADLAQTTFVWWTSVIHPEDLAPVLRKLEEHLQGAAPAYQAEYRMRTREGQWRWILSRGKVVDYFLDGRPARVSGTNLDLGLADLVSPDDSTADHPKSLTISLLSRRAGC